MTTTGLDVFDKTKQTTSVWLKEICEQLDPVRQTGWHVLRAGLRMVRHRLEPDLASHLAPELPVVVRGTYSDRYRSSEQPRLTRSREEFVKRVEENLQNTRPVDPGQTFRCVFGVLSHQTQKPDRQGARRAAGRHWATMA